MLMRVRAEWWAGCLILLLIAVFLGAGVWQLRRAQYKESMQASVAAAEAAAVISVGQGPVDAAAVHLRRVEARGEWRAAQTILLDNKVRDGVPGYEVVTPLQLAGGASHLLVNRGWVKAPLLRSELPLIDTPAGSITVEGVARIPNNRFLELGSEVITGKVWQNLTIERYQQWSSLSLQPVLLYQSGGAADGLQRVEVAPEAAGINADRHRGYALTWFSLAAVTFVLGLLAWRRNQTRH